MHYRRLASFVLGAWIASSVLLVVLMNRVRDVDPWLQSPPPEMSRAVEELKPAQARIVLRWQAWDQERKVGYWWGAAQLILGPLSAWLLLLSTRVSRVAIGAMVSMVVLACFSSFAVLPELTYSGRALDLASGWSADRVRYLLLHALYLGMEGLKVLLGTGVGIYLFTYHSTRVRSTASEFKALAMPSTGGRQKSEA